MKTFNNAKVPTFKDLRVIALAVQMDKYQKVKGSESFFRDPNNGAVLNVNSDEIRRAKSLKAERKKRSRQKFIFDFVDSLLE